MVEELTLPEVLSFDWDEGNLEKNWIKHKVLFKEAEEIFYNKPLKFFPDISQNGIEERFLALGRTNLDRKLTIIFTIRREEIRIISARAQSRKERSEYEKK